ncbi:MAG: hypothetical protein JST50_13680 [Bacteroidetes bacterium]|jgi:hypothetical protein|nr:hypothetical protein [Bacteroidota bacterium]
MKKTLTLLIFFQFFAALVFAQKSFEGEVVYSISIKSNTPKFTDAQLSSIMGTTQHYYMKGANYKSVLNGKMSQWEIYVNKNKKVYNKIASNDSILWNDVTINHDTIYKVNLKKNDTTILGYKCDKLTFTCNRGIEIYYFNPQFVVDPRLYINHQEGNWYAFLEKSRSIALKEIMQKKYFTFTLTAVSVKRKPIDDKLFELPPNMPLTKSKVNL